MSVLLDRIGRNQALPSEEQFGGHRFEACLALYFHGKFTRAQMLTFFTIPPAMEADFDKLKTKHDSAGGSAAQLVWMQDLHACVKALQFGDITKAQFNTFTGLTLATTG